MDRRAREPEPAARLVLALCHEVGSLVGAVRLQAHLVDERLSAVELAGASVEIDDLSARTSALLALVRPLLVPPPREGPGAGALADAVMAGVADELEAHGGRGVSVEVDTAVAPRFDVRGQPETLHQLLMSLAWYGIEHVRPKGRVRLRVETGVEIGPGRRGVAFRVEDDGPEELELRDWPSQPARGRPLACAVASHLVSDLGGRLEVVRRDDGTTISLFVPAQAGV